MADSNVEKSLDASIKDGAAYAVNQGLGEAYVTAGAVFLRASPSYLAWIATVPMFLGSCMQLLTPGLLDRGTSRKRIIVPGAVVQALAWIPMIAALWAPPPWNGTLLFSGFVLYWATLHLTLPAWTGMMGDLVPADARGRYFSRRNAAAISCQLAATAVGGLGLWIFTHAGRERLGFAVIFAGALAARLLSSRWLVQQWDPPHAPEHPGTRPSLFAFAREAAGSNFGRFVLFVGALTGSAQFAGAVFTDYALRSLKFTYAEYAAITTVIVFVQIPSLLFWGRLCDRHGNRRVLSATALGICATPLLWMGSTHVAWACVVQAVAGFSWAGFNLAAANFLLDSTAPARRPRASALLGVVTNTGTLLGGLGASWAIARMPTTIGPIRLPYAYWGLLVASFVLRAAVLIVFLPRVREVRDVPPASLRDLVFSRRPGEPAKP